MASKPGPESSRGRLRRLKREMEAACKLYNKWAEDFKVDRLEEFVVKSMQVAPPKGSTSDWKFNRDAYTVNLLLSSLNARIPALMFDRPHVLVTPKDPKADDMSPPKSLPALAAAMGVPAPPLPPSAEQKAKLREDLLNTIISDPRSRFRSEVELSTREAFFKFGMVEVFYTADFEDTEETEVSLADGKERELPKRLPKAGTERVVFKRIPAGNVRISTNSKNDLERCEWVAYCEWQYVADLRKNPQYKGKIPADLEGQKSNTDELLDTQEHVDPKAAEAGTRTPPADEMVKVWKLWHVREKKRSVWIDGEDYFLMDGKEYSFLPLAGLKFEEILDQWYPVPVAYNWTGVQIEYNETRDAQRVHRKRAQRKFAYQEGAFDDEEIAKLTSGEDMAFAKVQAPHIADTAIRPVEMAPMDPISVDHLALCKAELQEVTKVGGEQRGFAESKTASQANIISQNKQVQDSLDRGKVAAWLERLLWIALRTAEENFTLETVIRTSVDLSGAGAAQEQQKVAERWKAISMDQLGTLEYEVSVDVESLAPPNSTLMAQQWMQLIALLSNQSVLLLIAASETLARKLLKVFGIREEEDIQEIISVSKNIVTMLSGAGAAPMPGSPGGAPMGEGGGTPDTQALLQQALGSLQGGLPQ